MTYVEYEACLVWIASRSLTGLLVATTTAFAVTTGPSRVRTRAPEPTGSEEQVAVETLELAVDA
jgi:hypothetical protein